MVKDILPTLATKATLSAIDKLERKTSGRGPVRAEKDSLYLFQMKILVIPIKLQSHWKSQVCYGATEIIK